MIIEIDKGNYAKYFKEVLFQFSRTTKEQADGFFKEGNKLYVVVLDKSTLVVAGIGSEDEWNILASFESAPSLDYMKVLNALCG